MELITIKIQSYSDVITNSSSELFQIQNKTASEVYYILLLNGIIEGCEKPILFKLDEYRENLKRLNQLRNDCYNDQDQFEWCKFENEIEKNLELKYTDTVEGWFFDANNQDNVDYLYKCYLESKECPYFQEFCNYTKDADEEDILELANKFRKIRKLPKPNDIYEDVRKWNSWFFDYGKVEQLDGCVLLLSMSENSIPYENKLEIKRLFKCENYHLG